MRITGGHYKNRKLSVPDGKDVRPTSDRMRQSLFNMLHHAKWAHDFVFDGATVLDLFCGSGALGLEALSHGATHCVFVDADTGSIRKNAEFLPRSDYEVKKASALTVKLSSQFDLVFMDPPYRCDLVMPALQNIIDHQALAEGALIVIETEKEFVDSFDGFEICDQRSQGQSTLHILRYHAAIE